MNSWWCARVTGTFSDAALLYILYHISKAQPNIFSCGHPSGGACPKFGSCFSWYCNNTTCKTNCFLNGIVNVVNGNFTQLISLMMGNNLSNRNKCSLSDFHFGLLTALILGSGIFVCFILIQQIKGKEGREKTIFIPSGIESQPWNWGFCGHATRIPKVVLTCLRHF